MNEPSVSDFEHHRVFTLLPWWVNGTLEADELERVRMHLEHCPDCQAECEVLEQCQLACRAERIPAPDVEAALARVMRRIDSDPTIRSGVGGFAIHADDESRTSVREQIESDGPSPVRRHRSWAIAAVLVLGIAGFWLLGPANEFGTGVGDYTVLSSQTATSDAIQLDVWFVSRAAARDGIRHVQARLPEATSLTGWERTGEARFRIALDVSTTPDVLNAALQGLSASSRVRAAALVAP